MSVDISNSRRCCGHADGEFFIDVTNFDTNDGSRSIEAVKIDPSGTGDNFDTTGTMISNSDANPATDATQQLLAQLAASTVCTGGTDENLCLVSFTATDGFENCVVVSQPPGAGVENSASALATGQAAATVTANVANTHK